MRSSATVPGILLASLILGTGCGRRGGFEFFDAAAEAGIDVTIVSGDARRWYIPETNGSGAAWIDFDSDGDLDLLVGNGQPTRYVDDGAKLEILRTATCRLYRNDQGGLGQLRFSDATDAAGLARALWVNGVATGDVDNDGDPDLYLACFGPDVYFRNDGGRFTDATEAAGLGNARWGASAVFGDPDNDGDLDLYVANYCEFDPDKTPAGGKRNLIQGVEVGWGPEAENPGINIGSPDVYFRNEGAGSFVLATYDAGLELEKPLCSYAAVFTDLDDDGWSDLIVANDAQPTNLFHNQGNGTFREEGEARGFAYDATGRPTAAMGLAVEDVDADGDFDVLRTNFDGEANSLHVNDGKGHFVDRAEEFGLAEPSRNVLGWGCGFFDADCDGDLDLLVANGHVYPQAELIGMHPFLQPTHFFEAKPGPTGKIFYSLVDPCPGIEGSRAARALAFADVDDDGDVDVLATGIDEVPRLLRNETPRRGHFLSVRLLGTKSSRDGIGAKVTVYAGARAWSREMRTTQGLYASHDPRLHFGLGDVSAIDSVEVRWPSGIVQTVVAPALDTFLAIREAASK